MLQANINNVKLPRFFYSRSYLPKIILFLYLPLSIVYLFWLTHVARTWNLWFAVPLVILDYYTIAITWLHLITSYEIAHPLPQPPLHRILVDAIIPTYNEPLDVVRMTTLGALSIKGINKVFVTDDGHREEIKRMVENIGATYISRPDNLHAKAGNLNFALKFSKSEFLLFFDADHIAHPNFIEETSGFFKDSLLAFVQTPQLFYNHTSSIQYRTIGKRKFWNEQTMFYELLQPAKNRFNAAFFCGTGAMWRRTAIDDVGGFSIETATEDIHTSIRVHAKGWNSLFYQKPLAFGIAPIDLKEYHDQRVRWGAGSLGLMFRSKDSPFRLRGLSLAQRLCYFSSTNIFFYNGIPKFIYLIMPSIVLLSIPFIGLQNARMPFHFLLILFTFSLISQIVVYISANKTYRPLLSEQYNTANIVSCLVALKGIVRLEKKFKVSIKIKHFKESHYAYFALLIFAILMISSSLFSLYYWFYVLGRGVTGLFSSPIGSSLFWNTYNLFFVTSLVFFTRYNRKPSPKFSFVPTDKSKIVVIDSEDDTQVVSIDLSGAHIHSRKKIIADKIMISIGTCKIESKIGESYQDKMGYNYIIIFRLDVRQSRLLMSALISSVVARAHNREYQKLYPSLVENQQNDYSYHINLLQTRFAFVQ